MKDIKNCDAAVSHSSSIRNYSDPESRGGAMLFPGEDHVIPAVLHHEAVPGQAEQRRNRNPEHGGQNEQRRRAEDDESTLQDDSEGIFKDPEYYCNTSKLGWPEALHMDVYLVDSHFYVKFTDFSSILGIQKHLPREKTKLFYPFLRNQGF